MKLPILTTLDLEKATVLARFASENVETFRTDAMLTAKTYSRSERKRIAQFTHDPSAAYVIVTTWDSTLRPTIESVEHSRKNTLLKQTMRKHFLLDEEDVKNEINGIAERRVASLLEDFIVEYYPLPRYFSRGKVRSLRQNARQQFLLRSDETKELSEHLSNFMIYNHVAELVGIHTIDPSASLWSRYRSARAIKKERKDRRNRSRERLATIDQRLQTLITGSGELLVPVFDYGWDLVEIYALRNSYEKRLATVTKTKQLTVTERLELFDRQTHTFKQTAVEKNARKLSDKNLAATRKMIAAIDDILLAIFDLDNKGRNQLLLEFKEYRELIAEKAKLERS
jgi:hypothetical protein